MDSGLILVIAVRLAIVDHVEPVASPALAIARGSEQPVDQFLVGDGRAVSNEGIDLLGRGWKAVQIVGEPPDQCAAIGLRRGLHALLIERGQNEGVDRSARPIGFYGWWGSARQRPQ